MKSQEIYSKLQQGLSLLQSGRFDDAALAFRQVLKTHPENFDALHMLGAIALQKNKLTEGVKLIEKAIQINPGSAVAYNNCGLGFQKLTLHNEALRNFEKAINISPKYAEAHFNRGLTLYQLTRMEEAILSFNHAIQINPRYAEAYSNRGLALHQLDRFEEAILSFDNAIQINPRYAEAYSNRGLSLHKLARLEEAVLSFDFAVKINPQYAEAYSNQGLVLQQLSRFESAVLCFDKAIQVDINFAGAHYNRGLALQELLHLEEAIASFDRAISIKSNFTEALWNKSLCLLLNGDFENGWKLYESRLDLNTDSEYARKFSSPRWQDTDSLVGKTILLYGEQGFGDSIQFCRYTKLIEQLGAKVLLEVPESLIELFKSLDGAIELIKKGDPLPYFDCHCPLLSLPYAVHTTLSSIPNATPYLAPDAYRKNKWSQLLGPTAKLRVGIAWSGSTEHKNDRNRSLELQHLVAVLPVQYEYVSLQKEVRDIDKRMLEASSIRHFGNEINNFADTAALCDLMDLVISVDTSVAHLAGAIGKETWVMLPFLPDWRWLLHGDSSPWYPSVKILRQSKDRKWESVLKQIAQQLETRHL